MFANTIRYALLGTLAASAAACADSSLTIDNQSSVAFVEIHLAPIDTVSFGRDLLDGDVLLPGETVDILGIDCDTYDISVTTNANQDCVLETVDICFDAALWVIDDTELAICNF